MCEESGERRGAAGRTEIPSHGLRPIGGACERARRTGQRSLRRAAWSDRWRVVSVRPMPGQESTVCGYGAVRRLAVDRVKNRLRSVETIRAAARGDTARPVAGAHARHGYAWDGHQGSPERQQRSHVRKRRTHCGVVRIPFSLLARRAPRPPWCPTPPLRPLRTSRNRGSGAPSPRGPHVQQPWRGRLRRPHCPS